MTDAEIIAVRKATRTRDYYKPYADSIAFARAIIAALCESAGPHACKCQVGRGTSVSTGNAGQVE